MALTTSSRTASLFRKGFNGNRASRLLLTLTGLMLLACPSRADEALRLSLKAFSQPQEPVCTLHGAPSGVASPGKKEGAPLEPEESEHRPQPKRTYWLSRVTPGASLEAVVRRANGSVIDAEIINSPVPSVSFATPYGDGPVHGANNLYVVEQQVVDGMLHVRTAKWVTLHHNCGWGHDHKFDPTRSTPQPLAAIPFEIVPDTLWDGNFHSRVSSGDILKLKVLAHGQPVAGAELTVETDRQWSKSLCTDEGGSAEVQLIRDYYPSGWQNFQRTRRGRLLFTASFEEQKSGNFNGTPYIRVRYSTSLPWHYSPSSRDYASYAYGLLIGALALLVTGLGIFFYRGRRQQTYRGIVFK